MTAPTRDPWWIIGSAAVALNGVDPGGIADVDVLTSARDASAILAAVGCVADTCSDRSAFRSVYGRLPSPALPIEVMGGLEVFVRDRWRAITPCTRVAVSTGGVTVYVPEREDLIAILRLFGRAKDLARAALLC